MNMASLLLPRFRVDNILERQLFIFMDPSLISFVVPKTRDQPQPGSFSLLAGGGRGREKALGTRMRRLDVDHSLFLDGTVEQL